MLEYGKFPPLAIGGLNARLAIVQGGMGVGVSLSGLASAVAERGGIGVIAAAGIGLLDPDAVKDFCAANIRMLRAEIRRARELTKGVLGVNIMAALTDFAALVRTAVEEKIDIIFVGAGLPLNLPELVGKGVATKLAPIVSSARAAALILRRWTERYDYLPDAFVVEGPKAGGHLGFKKEQLDDPEYSLEKIVPEVVEAVRPFAERYGRPIPVIAGGGVYTGADAKRILELGASGVQMATRFVPTAECDADADFKQTYVDAKEGDLEIIASPVGLPGRAIRNDFLDEVAAGKKQPFACPFHCIVSCEPDKAPYCISLALKNAMRGRLKAGFAFAGSNAWRTEKIGSVGEVIAAIEDEYSKA
jgi:nitronate monooxygenase